mmetsp:Transcript_22862/g.43837  ORF Transcript_22862/g.43837 Transcript_22862/m.43837 type:complete len:80 (-) Transcript_22862:2435-2674(-)
MSQSAAVRTLPHEFTYLDAQRAQRQWNFVFLRCGRCESHCYPYLQAATPTHRVSISSKHLWFLAALFTCSALILQDPFR